MTGKIASGWTLNSLLNPSSVAVVGASPNPMGHTGRTVANLRHTGYQGRILPVTPRHLEISGLRCYASVAEIEEPPECAYVLVRADRVPDVAMKCAEAGVQSIVVCSSGFAEEGDRGHLLQDRIACGAQARGARILGPNCIGVVNPVDHFVAAPTFNLVYDYVPGGVAVLSQSGGIGVNVLNRAQGRGIGMRAMISVGNEADLDLGQLLDQLVDDDATTVVALVLEQLRDVPTFAAAVQRAHAAGKPVLALKLGTSEAGARSSLGHTGAMAGSHAVFSDVMQQMGVLEAGTLDELVNTAQLFEKQAAPRSGRVLVVSPSGGECTYLADRAAAQGLELPDLSTETRQALANVMRFGNPTNPLDLTGQVIGDSQILRELLSVLDAAPGFDTTLFGIATWGDCDAERLLPWFVKAAARGSRPTVFSAWTARNVTESAEQILRESGLPWFTTADEAVAAVALASQMRSAQGHLIDAGDSVSVVERPAFTTELPWEAEVKDFLGRQGLPVAEEVVVGSLGDAELQAGRLGWPVVVKQLAEGIVHKSDLGLVRLGISDREQLRDTWQAFDAAVRKHRLTSVGVLLARTYSGAEVIVGGMQEPSFGPVVMVGAGGVLAEQLDDKVFAVCPVSLAAAHEMIGRLKQGRILQGYRGTSYDTEALAEVVVRVSQLMVSAPWLQEVDLNPVLVHPGTGGATVVDAALVPSI